MAATSNFCWLEEEYSDYNKSRVAIVPVPYDGTSTWIKGSGKGPGAIIEASGNMEFYDIETNSEPYEVGIFTDAPVQENSSPERMAAAVEQRVARHIKNGKFTVLLGGEHSVSIGAARAHASRFKGLSVLQLDAHADLRDEYLGSEYNHACTMARIKETCPVVQVGIRAIDSSELPQIDKKRVFFAENICGKSNWAEKAISPLSKNVYLTIDLDFFDPSILPSTGTPEPGGLLWHETLAFLKKAFAKRNIVGFDVAELCPNEKEKSSDFLAAKLIYKLLAYKFKMKGASNRE